MIPSTPSIPSLNEKIYIQMNTLLKFLHSALTDLWPRMAQPVITANILDLPGLCLSNIKMCWSLTIY